MVNLEVRADNGVRDIWAGARNRVFCQGGGLTLYGQSGGRSAVSFERRPFSLMHYEDYPDLWNNLTRNDASKDLPLGLPEMFDKGRFIHLQTSSESLGGNLSGQIVVAEGIRENQCLPLFPGESG